MTVLLDTHAALWWAAVPEALSPAALAEIDAADELAISAISWWEIAWLARRGRITLGTPLASWMLEVGRSLRTVPLTTAIAAAAAMLGDAFPKDPGDRLIYATAVEHGWPLVSKDARLRAYDAEETVVVW